MNAVFIILDQEEKMEINPGLVLKNRYKIIRLLGKGGMGAVHLAYDTSLQTEVAVKSNHNPTDEGKKQFLKEARLLAMLRHPGLPRVIDHFLDGENQFLVMDYIPGDDLDSLLESEGKQPLEKVLKWVEEIGNALHYMHTQNPPVIHRDIKPANIKLTPEDEVILVDFGLAKADTQATAIGATGYSPGYAPPEQYGAGKSGPYSDQYSLAATMYKLLSGVKPIESINRLVENAQLTPITELVPNIPKHIAAAIHRALSVHTNQRFNTINEFIQSLKDPDYASSTAQPNTFKRKDVIQEKPEKRSFPFWIFIVGGISIIGVVLLIIGGIFGYQFLFGGEDNAQAAVVNTQTNSISIETTAAFTEEIIIATATQTPTMQPDTETPSPTMTFTETVQPTARAIVDERQIVFVSDRADGETLQLWSMVAVKEYTNEIIGTNFEQLTFDELDKTEPEWSPDGTKITYTADNQIWVLDLSAEQAESIQLTNLDGQNMNPTWSPDGEKIAFANFGRFTDVFAIYLMNADGSDLERLSFDFQEHSPIWSPDMEWFFYIIQARGHEYFFQRNQENEYATPAPYDPTTYFGQLGEVADPAWSPDGIYIAYTKKDGENRQIYIVRYLSRGSDFTLLTGDYVTEKEPAWSPDSQWIVFTSERDGNSEIYIMSNTGQLQTNLSNSPGIDMQPDWLE